MQKVVGHSYPELQILLYSDNTVKVKLYIFKCTMRQLKYKKSKQAICRALYTDNDSSLRCSDMARVNVGSQLYMPPIHLSMNAMNQIAFTPQLQSFTALWPVLISRSTDGRRLSWHGWPVTYRGGFSAQRWSPIPVLTGSVTTSTTTPPPPPLSRFGRLLHLQHGNRIGLFLKKEN